MSQSHALQVMAGNVLTTGLLALLLSFRSEPWWMWLCLTGGLGAGWYLGKDFWRDFFTDRLAWLGQVSLFLGLVLGICSLDPLWLGGFWLTIGGGLLGLGGALYSGIKFQEAPALLSPDPLVHHPLRVNRLLSIVFGWLIWSIVEIPVSWRAPLTILFVTVGLVGLGNWQLGIVDKKLRIEFSGIINISYLFNLDRFQRLLLVKLQEGGIAWLQLTNINEEVTLPIILLEDNSLNDKMTETIRQRYPLISQSTTRDSLQMMSILLPQAIGVFAAITCLILGTILWSALKLPESPSLIWILGGCFLISPILACALFLLTVPGSIAPQKIGHFPPWELGILLIIVQLISSPNTVPLLLATIVFLSWGIGIYCLHLVRVIPIGVNSAVTGLN